jgi:hypothetical protein
MPAEDYILKTDIETWKNQYSNHLGFAFISPSPISDQSIMNLVGVLKARQITKSNPIAVSKFGNTILFAYEDFDGPNFFSAANYYQVAFGLARIETLVDYLKNVK